jgi:hypothetical protein
MTQQDILLDLVERVTRVEVKLDTLLESNRRRYFVAARTYLAMIGAVTAIAIALWK